MSLDNPAYKLEGSGPLLVYVAGMDGTGELFFKQARLLRRRYKVATFRARDGRDFGYDDLTTDIASIIRDAGFQRAIMVGESFGGTVALNFALERPEMVERLVIVNSFPRFRGRIRIRLAAWLTAHLPFKRMWMARVVASSLGLFVDCVGASDRRRFFDAVKTVRQESYVRRLELIASLDIENRLSEISAPTLFIAGKRDLLVRSVKEANVMAALMPNAAVKILPRAGHSCLLNDEVDLSELLTEWIG